MTAATIRPLEDRDQLRAYIDEYWAPDHILARDPAMTEFTYATPFVDLSIFSGGLSVLGTYADDGRLIGFLGAIVAPYPRPQSYWLALWHVLPELKGTGMGGKLLAQMQEIALGADGWIGTFGAGPDALPVYLNRGYTARGVRRWMWEGTRTDEHVRRFQPAVPPYEQLPGGDWFDFRFDRHPVFDYERYDRAVFRTEDNEWGRVTHAVWLHPEGGFDEVVSTVAERERAAAGDRPYVLDAWSFEPPSDYWRVTPKDLPSVFRPPEARGNLVFAVGNPFLPSTVQKGDCDQDRPN
jgi:hypothetical protein